MSTSGSAIVSCDRRERSGREGTMYRFLRFVVATMFTGLCAGAGVAAACPPAPVAVIDSVAFDYLPAGLGTASDFAYHFERVDFVARVWESQIPDGWQVDLDIDVMRGARLSSGAALHDWFVKYEQRDPAPAYHRVRVHGRPGWLCRDQLFWSLRPGLAVSVQLDGTRWPRHEVVRTARSAYLST
jgi:hypothetical protein